MIVEILSRMKTLVSALIVLFVVSSLLFILFSISQISVSMADSTVVTDTFTRTESSGWGTSETGGDYTLTGTSSDFAVDGSAGTITAPTASTTRWAVLSTPDYQDVDITFKLKTDKVAAGISQEYFVIGRYQDSSNMYRSKIRLTPSNAVTLQGGKVVSGTETLLGTQQTVSGLSYSANSYINIRMKLTGTNPTTIELKAWADGDAEPGSYAFTSTDSEAALQTTGGVGLRLNMPSSTSNAPIVATFDDFIVTTSDVISSPTPTPTAAPQSGLTLLTDTFTRSTSSSWGTADSGGEYLINSGSADNFNTTGSVGTINSATASVTRSLIMNNSLQQDVDIMFKVKLDKVPVGTSAEIFWQARRVDPSNLYRGKIRLTPSNSVTVQATKVVSGSETLLGTQASTGISYNADEYIYIRSQITGTNPTTINMKAWHQSETEPIDWDYTTTDSESALQSDGSIGFRTNFPSGITNVPILASFDDISVTTADAQINNPTAEAQDGTVIANDTFTRTTSNGFGTADTGGDYTINSGSSSSFSTDGSEGQFTNSTSSTSRAVSLDDVKQQDVDALVKMKVNKIPTGSAAEGFIIGRRLNIANQYRAKVRFTTSNSITLQASNVVDGVETLLGTQTSAGISYVADTFIWVRTKFIGTNPTTIYMKAWAVGDTEPVSWQYIVDDYSQSSLQGPGAIGLRSNLPSSVSNAPIVFSFDDLNVTTTDIDIYDPSTAPTPSPTPTPPSSIDVTVNLNQPPTVSKLEVGVTHTQESSNSGADSTAITAAKQLLEAGVAYQNQHIIGFGASNLWDDPSKAVEDWNWSALDRRVQLMRDTNSIPIITLCCGPTWMVDPDWSPGKYNGSNTDWGQLEEAPLDIYESDFAYMVQQIVERYDGVNTDENGVAFPEIKYFQVWNEMKGLWDRDANTWNITKYNRMYGLIYDTIKAVRSDAQIGGPYIRFSKYLYPTGVKISTVKDSDAYGTVDNRDLTTISDWLTWLNDNRDGEGNLKAQFVTVDGSITTKDITDGSFPTDIWNATKFYSDINSWLNDEMTSIIGTQIPIWWAEDYVGKVNGDSTLITSTTYQPSALATMLRRHALNGTSVSLRWGPEEQVSSVGVAQGNRQNLYSSTEFAGGGQAYENYNVYKYFNDYFSNGTNLYPTTISPSTDAISALSSSSKTLLINKTSSSITVNLTANSITLSSTIPAYGVSLMDTPSNSQNGSSSGSSSSNGTIDCPFGFIYCPNLSSLKGGVISSRGIDMYSAKLLYYPPAHSIDLVASIKSIDPYVLAFSKKVPLPWSQGFNIVSDIFDFSAFAAFNGYPVNELPYPGTAIIHYRKENLYNNSPKIIQIAYFNPKINRWELLKSSTILDISNNLVATIIRNLGYYVAVVPREPIIEKPVDRSNRVTNLEPTVSPTFKPVAQPASTKKFCFFGICF